MAVVHMHVYGCMWLYMAAYGCIWLYMAVYGYIWVYGCIWRYIAIGDVFACDLACGWLSPVHASVVSPAPACKRRNGTRGLLINKP